MRFPDSFLDEIRARLPISTVIGERVTWDRRRTNANRGDWWACCPFHGEKSPSFHCEDGKGRYHCFGCGASGDHFSFLTELDGIGFSEAVERLAAMAGLPLPQRDPGAEKRASMRASLYEVMELAARYFADRLQSAEGAAARAYLRERRILSATQQQFRLGYAPGGRNQLREHLVSRKVSLESMAACGLVATGPDIAVPYDRFRDRIIFPILDARERVIAFGGRAMDRGVAAKYLNSPETELFHKGEVLYNLAAARKAAGRGGSLILVEGYMDVIALAQAGIGEAVAPLGTALTAEQLTLLWQACDEPILCFDGDAAGMKAAWRAAELALPLVRPGKSLRFALLPENRDPDDLVREEGGDAMRKVLAGARPLADMLWSHQISAGSVETPERRAALERSVQQMVRTIRDDEVRRHYEREMRERLQAHFGPLPSRTSRQRGPARPGRLTASESLVRSVLGPGLPARECALIATLIHHPALIDEFFEEIGRIEPGARELDELLRAVLEAVATGESGSPDAVRAVIGRMGLGPTLERVLETVRRMRAWPALESAALPDARDAFAQALHLHRAAGALHKELKEAEIALAEDPTEENYRRLLDVQAQIRAAQATEAIIEGFGSSSGRGGHG
jgi:DNA primase